MKKPNKPVPEKAFYRMGIPRRYVELTMADVPDALAERTSFRRLIEHLDSTLSRGGLLAFLGPFESGRDPLAFILAKEARRHRYHGFCVSGLQLRQDLVFFEGDLESGKLRNLDFILLYDLDVGLMSAAEEKAVLGVITSFHNDRKLVILTAEELASWRKHPRLRRVAGLLKATGRVVKCSGTWMPGVDRGD